MAIPPLEPRGTPMLEDVGVAIPQLPDLMAGIERVGVEYDTEIAVIAHAGDGNTHPLDRVSTATRTPTPRDGPGRRSTRSCGWRSRSAAPSPASTASVAPRSGPFPISSARTSWP